MRDGVLDLEILSHAPDAPRGAPVLFVHGAWQAAWCWEEHFLAYFAERGRTVHAVSLRGHGGSASDRSLRRTRIRHYVEDVRSVVERIASPVIVGHSMGAFVVQNYLQRHEAPAAVLMTPVPPRGAWGATFHAVRRHPLAFLKTNLTLRLYPLVAPWKVGRDLLFSHATPDAVTDRYRDRFQDESYTAYLDMLLFSLVDARRIRTPMLVVGADDDALFPPGSVSRTAKAYNARCESIPSTGHEVMLEPRWREAADAILRWLEERGV